MGVVPPHLLRGIAESSSNPHHIRENARASLAAISKKRGQGDDGVTSRPAGFVPGVVLHNISESEHVDEDRRVRAKRDLQHLETIRGRAQTGQQAPITVDQAKPKRKDSPYRPVYDAEHSFDEADLPGKLVRAGADKAEDKAVNQAYDNVGAVLKFYKDVFKWNSIDNKNMDVVSSVHFGEGYQNAFWDPEKLQMVFGDGDDFLNNFTGCIDVIGHELTHAVTEHTSPLDYYGQPGALNEHVSDVFGIMIKQKSQNEDVSAADWLIREDCILPGVKGVALRSMKSPGTAYDDPRFGKDPQVGTMKDFKITMEDNGGVHIFSGIPNKAFYLVCQAFGGNSWETPGQIWWKAMKSGKVPAKCTFRQFANLTIDMADEFGDSAVDKVTKAWDEVGVTKGV